jgi:hypothetical protein
MTILVERRQLLEYLDTLNAGLGNADDVKKRVQDFRNKEQHESSSVALPFRDTSKGFGTGDIKMQHAVDAYTKRKQQIRDSLKSFLDDTAEVDTEHGGKVREASHDEKIWTT